eukprot:8593016-Alexandrium_andersonii.AAC.1
MPPKAGILPGRKRLAAADVFGQAQVERLYTTEWSDHDVAKKAAAEGFQNALEVVDPLEADAADVLEALSDATGASVDAALGYAAGGPGRFVLV